MDSSSLSISSFAAMRRSSCEFNLKLLAPNVFKTISSIGDWLVDREVTNVCSGSLTFKTASAEVDM